MTPQDGAASLSAERHRGKDSQKRSDAVEAGRAHIRVGCYPTRDAAVRGNAGRSCPRRPGYQCGMSTILQRITKFLSSPAGRRVVEQGRRELAKPANQEKLRRLAAKVSGGRRH